MTPESTSTSFCIEYYCGDRFGWRKGTRRWPSSNLAFFEMQSIQIGEKRAGLTSIPTRLARVL